MPVCEALLLLLLLSYVVVAPLLLLLGVVFGVAVRLLWNCGGIVCATIEVALSN